MKSFKTLGKAGIAIILVALLLANVIVPLTVVGSDGASSDLDFQYYVVKTGDTFSSIARQYGISVSEIRNANDMTAVSKLYTGQILKIPVSTNYAGAGLGVSKMSLDVEDANIKDVISAIALNAGYTVVYRGGDATITLKLEDVSPIKAIDYATRMADMSFLKDGNTLFVGSVSDLNSKFVDSVVLAEYSLKYITADILQSAMGSIGLENVTTLQVDTEKSKIWISAYPKEVAKIKELIDILDTSTNVAAGSTVVPVNFSPINMNYIDASEFSSLLGTLGFDAGIVMSSKPYTLYTYQTGTDLSNIMKIKAVVDTPAYTPDSVKTENGNSEGVVNSSNSSSSSSSSSTSSSSSSSSDSSGSTSNTEESTILYAKELQNVTRDVATKLLAELGANVEIFGRSEYTKMIYLYGKKSDVNRALDLLKDVIDVDDAAVDSFFVYTPVNSTVKEILSRASNLNLTGVNFYQYSNDEIAESFMVFCKEGDKEYVESQLDELDGQTSNEIKWRPLESADDAAILNARIDTIKDLYTDVASLDFKVVPTTDLSGNLKQVIYVNSTADKAEYVKSLLSAMDQA